MVCLIIYELTDVTSSVSYCNMCTSQPANLVFVHSYKLNKNIDFWNIYKNV